MLLLYIWFIVIDRRRDHGPEQQATMLHKRYINVTSTYQHTLSQWDIVAIIYYLQKMANTTWAVMTDGKPEADVLDKHMTVCLMCDVPNQLLHLKTATKL